MAHDISAYLRPNDPIVRIGPKKMTKKYYVAGWYYDLKKIEGDKVTLYFGCRAEQDIDGVKFDLSRARSSRAQSVYL